MAAVGLAASAGLVLTADLLVDVLLGRGEFDAAAARGTAAATAALGAGAWAACGLSVLFRAFYAAGDRRTPVRLGVWAVGVNLSLDLLLVGPLGVAGLCLAGTAATCGQFAAATVVLGRAVPGWRPAAAWGGVTRAVPAVLAAAGACGAVRVLVDGPPAGELAVCVAAAAAAFALVTRVCGPAEVWAVLPARRPRPR